MKKYNTLRRELELVVISDVHLGTRGSHAKELIQYLKSIRPQVLVLNGDIIDIWQFSKRYWPNSHTKVLKQILNLSAKGTQVYYLTGNHDEKLRKLVGLKMGNFEIRNTLEYTFATGERALLFHGDVFDAIMQHSKWIARVGAVSYDALIALNVLINATRNAFGYGKVSLSKRVKQNVKSAVSFINSFETTAAHAGIRQGFDSIVCGHIHQPADRMVVLPEGEQIRYLNSGDWVENLTALEHDGFDWHLYNFRESVPESEVTSEELDDDPADLNERELFAELLKQFQE